MKNLQPLITQHWNDRATSYQSNINKDFMAPKNYARWQELITSILGTQDNLTILDAGCGPGVLSHILANHGNHRIIAADISESMVRKARGNLADWSDRVDFLCQDITELSLPDEHFDLIISRYVLWTVPYPERALTEWHRLLKPGGKIAIIDGNWYRAYYRSPLARFWTKCVHLYYRRRNDHKSSQKLATNYAASLSHTHLLRPDWDIGLLTGLGFQQITAQHRLNKRIYGRSLKRLLSPFTNQFLIQAVK
jgi:ubiquinone/menaquinone biosynthesis C-methylase UbiE